MVASLQDSIRWFLPPGIFTLLYPFPDGRRVGLCEQKNTAEVMVCHFLNQIIKDAAGSLCFGLFSRELPYGEATEQGTEAFSPQPARNWCRPTTRGGNIKEDLQAQESLQMIAALGKQLDGNLIRDTEPEPPSLEILRFLTLRNCVRW